MTDEAKRLQQRILSTIPISQTMQFSIGELTSDKIVVLAPLGPNVNIHGTGFAGSLYSLAVLTGWALCTHLMEINEISGELVVGKADIRYRSAVTDDIECRCEATNTQCVEFVEAIKTRGKGRLELKVEIGTAQQAVLNASYVAFVKDV